MLGGGTRHLVQHSEAAVDLAGRSPVLLDAAGQVLAETGVKEVIVIADLKSGFGEEVGKVLFEIVINRLKTGPRVAVDRRISLLKLT